MMKHPFFSNAWQTEMNYFWDSRTVTGVVSLKACRNQQTMSMSKSAIYDQLVSEYGEQFTAEEAQYAIDHLDD